MKSGFCQTADGSPILRLVRRAFASALLVLPWLGTLDAPAQSPALDAASAPAYRGDRILVMPKPGVQPNALDRFHANQKAVVLGTFAGIGGLQVLQLPEGELVPGFIVKYQQSGLVEFAEPDYARQLDLAPDDPSYVNGTLWGLNNYGQSGGTVDADIDAQEAWDVLNSASNIVVAVLDTGIRRTHEDLAANVWVNPLDGSCGWNALTGTNNPADDEGHGSLVSGVLGAVGNNGAGVVGVAWYVQIMACKCFDSAKNGYDSDIIECIEFARTNGARILNASLGGAAYSQALSNAVFSAREAGIILVASSGNSAVNVDVSPRYPACYDLDNIVVVAATTRNDALWGSSNYGATNVDLAAPGAGMYSTFYSADNSYLGGSFLAGTSLAAPYVTGSLALMLAKFPADTHQQIIARLLNATDPLPSLASKCVTGGRLNLRRALSPPLQLTPLGAGLPFPFRVAAGPNRSCVLEVSTNLTSWSPLVTNTTSPAGAFDYTDSQSTNAVRRFYRAVAAP